MSPRILSLPKEASPGKPADFKRVYQACENCRQKKQKCYLGDPAGPKPPCQACRRANKTCEKRRKGRPPRKPREGTVRNKSHVTTASEDGTACQTEWQTYMGRFEPVVAPPDDASTRTSPSSSNHGQKESISYDLQIARQRLASFPLRNTSDAIRLLVHDDVNSSGRAQNASNGQRRPTPGPASMLANSASYPTFFLLQEGLIDEATLLKLFRFYLNSVHPIMPLIPHARIPIAPEQVLAMASREMHFMAAILVVTAALAGNQDLHDRLWPRVQSLFAEVAVVGANASMEVIEGLILLSEYPPNMGHGTRLGCEDTMCWMTVGTAVRLGYLLGLEQLGMPADDVDETLDNRDRGKVAWSYCFCLDRQISIRVGKTFWHRSPGMTYQHLHVDAAEDFPELRDIPGIQDDYAAYLQSHIQINQVLTNAHDILYPSKSQSISLAKAEHYFKHIDEFTETLSAFRNRWHKRPWRTYPLNECVWISFHHLRLYIYSFSLQAYMQRVSSSNSGTRHVDYFPTGLMGTSDARFIIEAINAAADVLRLGIGRLQPPGAFSYLPLKYFLYFSHAGVFLLKVAVIIPLPPSQKRAILCLIQALIKAMSTASSNPKHPGIRYSSALDGLLRRISRDCDLQSPSPTRPPSPPVDARAIAAGTEASVVHPDENDLPALLAGKESSFVAERPFHDLAADLDAFLPLAPGYSGITLQPPAESCDASTFPTNPFASLFNNNDGNFWELFTATTLE